MKSEHAKGVTRIANQSRHQTEQAAAIDRKRADLHT